MRPSGLFFCSCFSSSSGPFSCSTPTSRSRSAFGDQRLILISTTCCPVPYSGRNETALAVNRSGCPFDWAKASEQTSTTSAGATVSGRNFMTELLYGGRAAPPWSFHSRRVPGQPRDIRPLIRTKPRRRPRAGIGAQVIGRGCRRDDHVASTVAQDPLEQRLRPRGDAERGERFERIAAHR